MTSTKLKYRSTKEQTSSLQNGAALSLPKGWVIKKLGEVYDVRDGTHDSPKYVKEGYALITSKNLKNDCLNYDKVNHITEQDYININKRSKVDVGDVLFAMIGTIGNPVVIKEEPDFAIKNVALFKVTDNQNSQFLKYYLDSSSVIEKMSKDAKGATQKFVGLGYLRNFPIPLPPLPEQQRIVSILDQAFASIDKAKANAEKNLQNAKELFESYLQGVFGGSTGSPTKRDGWEEKKLDEVCTIKPNKKLVREKLKGSDLVSFVPMKYLSESQMTFNSNIEKPLNEVYKGYVYFEEEDVVLAKITPCFENGKLGIARNLKNKVGFGSSEYVVYRVNNELILPEFLYFFLNRNEFRVKGASLMSGAVGHKRIQPSFYEKEIIWIPNVSKQNEILRILNHLQSEIQKLEAVYQKKIAALDELKKSMLAKAFRGELGVEEGGIVAI